MKLEKHSSTFFRLSFGSEGKSMCACVHMRFGLRYKATSLVSDIHNCPEEFPQFPLQTPADALYPLSPARTSAHDHLRSHGSRSVEARMACGRWGTRMNLAFLVLLKGTAFCLLPSLWMCYSSVFVPMPGRIWTSHGQ